MGRPVYYVITEGTQLYACMSVCVCMSVRVCACVKILLLIIKSISDSDSYVYAMGRCIYMCCDVLCT